MLVLSRHVGEQIRIGDVVISVAAVCNRNKVRLAIDAPRDVPVHREEVYQAIKAQEKRRDLCE